MTSTASPSNAFNFNGQGPTVGAQRRPVMQPQGLVGMGGMGGSMRPLGKSGLTFDQILSHLQGKLQKCHEAGAELHSLNGSMSEIHDTLDGTTVSHLAVLPQRPHHLIRLSSQPISLRTSEPSPSYSASTYP